MVVKHNVNPNHINLVLQNLNDEEFRRFRVLQL